VKERILDSEWVIVKQRFPRLASLQKEEEGANHRKDMLEKKERKKKPISNGRQHTKRKSRYLTIV